MEAGQYLAYLTIMGHLDDLQDEAVVSARNRTSERRPRRRRARRDEVN
jgi:hypothetical protein